MYKFLITIWNPNTYFSFMISQAILSFNLNFHQENSIMQSSYIIAIWNVCLSKEWSKYDPIPYALNHKPIYCSLSSLSLRDAGLPELTVSQRELRPASIRSRQRAGQSHQLTYWTDLVIYNIAKIILSTLKSWNGSFRMSENNIYS